MSRETLEQTTATSTQAPRTSPFSWSNISRRMRTTDFGQLPVVLALIFIALFFEVRSDGLFLNSENLTNLVLQIGYIGTVGLAAVLVLLIGEIDLSLGVVAYTCAAVTGVLSVEHGWSAIPALLAGLVAGALIGLVNGVFVAILRVPSFVVTLAGLLAYQGVVLALLYPQTSLILVDPYVANIATTYLPNTLGIGLPIAAVVIYAGALFWGRIQRQRKQLVVPPLWTLAVRVALAAIIVGGTVFAFEGEFGVPQVAAILIGLVLLLWLILRFSAYGRHVYAVGGNAEAARRAGIGVTGIRISIFVLASVLAAVGGILLASRQDIASAEVDQTLLLNAIATAVIGGVSLFGGRGSVWGVVLGSLIIGGLANGLDLLNVNSSVKFILQGIVLLLAVTIDAVVRRRSAAAGR
jgi:D-xylose transport system permease protein